jgi:pimeloyl-ACP methyl ester carboxylesterase
MRIPVIAGLAVIAGAAYFGARKLAVRETLDWEAVEKPGKLIDVDAYRVHYVEAGSGPAILMLHGFGGTTASYREMISRLARDHRCIAVDLKGFGYSERDATTGLSHTDQVAMLVSLLDRLGVDRAVVIGHSMGGAVAQRFGATHPERVEALVLAATVPADRRMGRSAIRVAGAFRPVLTLLEGFAARALLRSSFHDPSLLTPELRDMYLRPAHIRGSRDGLMKMIADSAERDEPVDLSRLTMPVLILAAAHDRIGTLAMAQAIRERIPHARLVVIERAAHLLLEERPDDCVNAIRDFLRDAASAPDEVTAVSVS